MQLLKNFKQICSLLVCIFFFQKLDAFNLNKLIFQEIKVINDTAMPAKILIVRHQQKEANNRKQKTVELLPKQKLVLSPLSNEYELESIIPCDEAQNYLLPVEREDNNYELHIVTNKHPLPFGFIPPVVDYEKAMGQQYIKYRKGPKSIHWRKNKEDFYWTENSWHNPPKEHLDFLKNLYEKNNLSKVSPQPHTKIPKIIHQVFFSKPIPDKYLRLQQTWKKYHPDWEYKLWDSENIAELGNFENKDYFDSAANHAEKTDILRYVLLERFGGLYADMDCECFEPFDILNHAYDFYACLEPHISYHVNLALLGATPHHPIIQECIKNVRKYHHLRNSQNGVIGVCLATGPGIISKSIWTHAGLDERCDIVFPATFFCPYVEFKSKVAGGKGKPETFAFHYWTGSWY